MICHSLAEVIRAAAPSGGVRAFLERGPLEARGALTRRIHRLLREQESRQESSSFTADDQNELGGVVQGRAAGI